MSAIQKLGLPLPLAVILQLSLVAAATADEDWAAKQVELKQGDRIIFFGDSLTNLAGEEKPTEHVKKGYVRIVRDTLAAKHADNGRLTRSSVTRRCMRCFSASPGKRDLSRTRQ